MLQAVVTNRPSHTFNWTRRHQMWVSYLLRRTNRSEDSFHDSLGPRNLPKSHRAKEAGRVVRVHPMFLLFSRLSTVLVEL